jgi:hypothetical protein
LRPFDDPENIRTIDGRGEDGAEVGGVEDKFAEDELALDEESPPVEYCRGDELLSSGSRLTSRGGVGSAAYL